MASWQASLAKGETRQQVAANFVESPEAVDEAVNQLYGELLGRSPELGARGYWGNILREANGSSSAVAIGILSSPEFIRDSI